MFHESEIQVHRTKDFLIIFYNTPLIPIIILGIVYLV